MVFFLQLVADLFFSVQFCALCLMSVEKKSSDCPLMHFLGVTPGVLLVQVEKQGGNFMAVDNFHARWPEFVFLHSEMVQKNFSASDPLSTSSTFSVAKAGAYPNWTRVTCVLALVCTCHDLRRFRHRFRRE